MRSRLGDFATYVVAVLLGAAAGVVGSFVQAVTVEVGSADLPVGLLIALAFSAAAFVWSGVACHSRIGVLVAMLPWVVVVVVLAVQRAEGDLIVTGQVVPLIWMFGGVLVSVGCFALPYGPTRAAPTHPDKWGEAQRPVDVTRVGQDQV